MSGEFNSVDDFLKHSGGESGNKSLSGWNKNKPDGTGGEFNSWLVLGCLPRPVWRHPFVEFVLRDDKDNAQRKLKNVWMRNFVCREDESILKKQRFLTPEKYREHPPRVCPDCITREVIRGKIIRGEIRDTDVVFEFTGSDKPIEDRVYHAGGFVGLWKRDLPQDEADRLAQAGIFMNDSGKKVGAWAENFAAQLGYLLIVVNNDDPSAGVLVTVEREAMGKKIKKVIADQMKSEGPERGNPFVTPYCIQWSYDKAETNPQEKYSARRINMFPLTPAIEALIRGPHPDVSREVTPPNLEKHRTMLERHATIPLEWDRIFKPAMDQQRALNGNPTTAAVPSNYQQQAPAARPPAQPATTRQQVAPPKPAEEWGEPCDPPCNAPMLKGQTVCGKCGAKYQEVPSPATAAPPAPPASPQSGPAQSDQPETGIYDDGQIPF